jgi:hypothetical protein
LWFRSRWWSCSLRLGRSRRWSSGRRCRGLWFRRSRRWSGCRRRVRRRVRLRGSPFQHGVYLVLR